MATDKMMIEEQAIAWTIRARDPDFGDWDALTAWLEADLAHAEAFERMTMLDDMLPELLPTRPVVVQHDFDMPQPRRWSFARLGAVAAVILAVIGLSFLSLQYLPYSVETGAGERQTIALADGSTIELNGNTKIKLSRSVPRYAELETGEALFTVVHNDRDPFVVDVGGAVVEDAGTVFNIVRSGNSTEVGVSEGLVIYNPKKERVALKPGQALRAVDGSMRAETFPVPVAAVGGWKRNQLTYNGASMDRVAADLSRSLGRSITASAEVRNMRFTGTINVPKDADRFVEETAPVLGVGVRRTEDGLILAGGDDAIR